MVVIDGDMGYSPHHRLGAIAPAAAILVVDGDDVPAGEQVKHARDVVSGTIMERRARLYDDIRMVLVGHGRIGQIVVILRGAQLLVIRLREEKLEN